MDMRLLGHNLAIIQVVGNINEQRQSTVLIPKIPRSTAGVIR